MAVVNSGAAAGNTSTDNDDDKKSKRGRSPSAAADDTSSEIERNQTNDESEFGMSYIRISYLQFNIRVRVINKYF